MTATLIWTDVLNEQATWASYNDAATWLTSLFSKPIEVPAAAVERFHAELNFIRSQVFALHFGEAPDLASINEKLKLVRMELRSLKDSSSAGKLPCLVAAAAGPADEDLILSVSQTVLVQFASFLGAWLQDPESNEVSRCEGLYREPGAASLSPVHSVPSDIELQWRQEIPLLVEQDLLSKADVLRCADLFISARSRTRFCSDECRFRTFQISKQLTDPGYLAAKQRRYRQKMR